ncbi:MAG TPA: hypothetical protein VFV38_45790 [Ktedonobacteraceae bacterium]|nr:hypothetical protein [Ktedonobacteraceae bacterium]
MAKKQRSQVRVVACGLDTVVANILPVDEYGEVVRRELPDELQAELDAYKLQAQEEEEKIATRWSFARTNLLMLDKAGAPFKWILEHPKIKVSIGRGVRAPLWGEVRFSSEYLWEYCRHYDQAFSDVWCFLNLIFGESITLQASGVDLAKDFTGWDVGALKLDQLRDRLITRAQSDDARPLAFTDDGLIDGPESIKRRWKRLTGLPFGKRNAAVSAILYDKTHEIRYQSPEKAWMYDVWQVERDENGRPVLPVWRLEGRLRRKALREGGIETLWELLERLPDIWAYLVGHVGGGDDGLPDGWLRYVVPTEDTNRSRWPVAPEWEVLQVGFAPVDAPGAPVSLAPFIRQRKREINLGRAVASVAGYASTFEVFRRDLYNQIGKVLEAEPDISDTFHSLFEEVQAYLEEKSKKRKNTDFASVVAKKSLLYHVVPSAVRKDESEESL